MTDVKIIRQDLRATSNINVAVTGVGVIQDGVSITDGMAVFLTAQDTPAEDGPWIAHTGAAWTRHPDFDTSAEMLAGTMFKVVGGSGDNKGSLWRYDGPDNPTVGTTPLTFIRETWGQGAAQDGTGVERDGAQWNLQQTGTPTGYFTRVQVDEYGRAQDAEQQDAAVTFLEGLRISRISNTSFKVEAGSAYIPDPGYVVELEVDATVVAGGSHGLPSTFAVGWYFVYLVESGGEGEVVITTVAPTTTAYRGGARTSGPDGSPDTTRRLIGEVYATSSTALRWPQDMGRGFVRHVADLNSTLKALSGSVATFATDLDVIAFAPPYADGVHAHIRLVNSDNTSAFYVTAAGDGLMSLGGTESAGQLYALVVNTSASRMQASGPIAFAGSRTLRHRQTAGGGRAGKAR